MIADSVREIEAAGFVPAPPPRVFAFLADLENHWHLADPFIEILSLERPSPEAGAHGGRIRMHGPFGLARTAVTCVLEATPTESMSGSAQVGRRTSARVRWGLTPHHGGTWVHLSAELEQANVVDRLLLALGGRTWFRRRFAAVIRRLGDRFSAAMAAEASRPEATTAFVPADDPSGEGPSIAYLGEARRRRGLDGRAPHR